MKKVTQDPLIGAASRLETGCWIPYPPCCSLHRSFLLPGATNHYVSKVGSFDPAQRYKQVGWGCTLVSPGFPKLALGLDTQVSFSHHAPQPEDNSG